MLKMKPACERCSKALAPTGAAWICSYECTFCGDCTTQMDHICPNCSGTLVPRPTRERAPAAVAVSLVGKKVKGLLGAS